MKKVIFDMDGLLFDSERVFMRELGIVMQEYGYTLTLEHYLKTLGKTVKSMKQLKYEDFGKDYPHEEISIKAGERMVQVVENGGLPVKKGIPELLMLLREHGISCVVASSTATCHVRKYLQATGLECYFDEIIGGEMTELSKPNPDIFIKALGTTAPEDALVLEDSPTGIIAAYRAHIPVICIPDLVYPDEDTRALALAVLSSAEEVVPYIFQ